MNTIRTAIGTTLLAASVGLAGCAAAPAAASTSDDIVIIVGARTGSPQVTGADLDDLLVSLFDDEGDRASIVVLDGEPSVVHTEELDGLSDFGDDRDDQIEEAITRIKTYATNAQADGAEADAAEAVALGASLFREGTRRTMSVYDSGLATTGVLDMTEGRLYAGADILVENATQHNAIPDLSGVAVTMPRLGLTAEPQKAVNADARSTLTEIWRTFFEAAGAASVDFEPGGTIALPQNSTELPAVTPVEIERPGPVAAGCSQLLTGNTIGFESGSSELADPVAALAVIQGIHAALAGCSGDYRVDASASSEGDAEANRLLTIARGETVAALVEQVSGQGDVDVFGWGEEWPCRVADVDGEGTLILDAAIRNRSVAISKGEPAC